jgi:hypothetical protein
MKHSRQHLLSFATDRSGQYVAVHVDLRGVDILIEQLQHIKRDLELNECPHTHLFVAKTHGYRELTDTKLASQENEVNVVHQVKIYGWNEEWARKHGLKPKND